MTSYQIKSTPFFRRMLSTSKKNGELQRLKDEYDRIKDFNDRTIELRMRQLRLKRLYKEIDDIRESTMSIYNKRRGEHVERRKTAEELRNETITRSKELGNMFMYERQYVPMPSPFQVSPQFEAQLKEYQKVKERMVKSIDYGNEISRFNMRKMKEQKSRTNTTATGAGTNRTTRTKAKTSASVTATATTTTLVPTADMASDSHTMNELNELSGEKSPLAGSECDSSCTKHMHCEELRRENRAKRSQLKQRLQYGNSWSSHNVSKIQKRNQRHHVITEPAPTTPRAKAAVTKAKATMQIPALPASSAQPAQPPLPPKPQSDERMAAVESAADERGGIVVKLTPLEQSARYLQALEELQQAQAQMRAASGNATATATATATGNVTSGNGNPHALREENARERARRHWRKIGLAVRSRSDEWRHRKLQQQQLQQQQQQRLHYHQQQQQLQQQQYHQQQQQLQQQQLQQQQHGDASTLASTKTALPLHMNLQRLHQQLLLQAVATNLPPEVEHELDSEGALETADEYVVSYEDDDDGDLALPPPPPPPPAHDDNEVVATTTTAAAEDIPLPPPSTSEYGANLDQPELATKVHRFIRPYESVVRATAAKEAVEYTVQNLRHIFEHHH